MRTEQAGLGEAEAGLRQVLWSLLSLLVTLGLVVGVPAALVVFVGWPLPAEVPTWQAFSEALEQQGITIDVLVKALAVVVWLAWLPLAWAISVETLAAVRGRAAGHVHAWPGAQHLARKLVASATLLLSSVGAVRHAGAAPLDPLVVAGAEEASGEALSSDPYLLDDQVIDLGLPGSTGGPEGGGSAHSVTISTPATPPSGEEQAALGWRTGTTVTADVEEQSAGSRAAPQGQVSTAYGQGAAEPEVVRQVTQGDSFWGLAEEYLGSGMRWREIRDHNVGRAVASGHVLAPGEDHLQSGWRIAIPFEGTTFSTSTAAPAPPAAAGARLVRAPGDAAPTDEAEVSDGTDAPGADTPEADTAEADAPEVVHEVDHGDTFWGLAETYLGDGSRWPEIRDQNVGRTVAPGRTLAAAEDRLEVGWRVVVSASDGVAPAASPVPAGAATGPTAVTVQAGDHFWGVAEQQLEQAWGRSVSAEEIAPYWQQLVTENLDRLGSGDPDLIRPGEQFTAPAPPPSPDAGEAPPSSGDDEAEPGEEGAEAEEAEEAEGDGPSGDLPSVPGEAGEAPSGEAPTGPDTAEETEEAEAGGPGAAESDELVGDELAEVEESLADAVDDDEAADEDESSGIPLLVPLGASAALAGLLLVALNRRRFSRRRQLRPGQVVQPREEEDAELEREFALGARDVLQTVEAASRGYGAVLAGDPGLPTVTGLLVSPARDVLMYLAEPALPEIPFERGPASDRWELYLDELDLDPEFGPGPEPSSSVLDTPAVIGRTDEGDWALIDLESVGALEIEGDEEVASDLVRSIVAELSMAPQAERMVDITVVGVEGLGSDVFEQGVVSFDRLDEDLVRRVERVAAETDSVQPHRGAAARAQGLSRDGLFVMVVALGGAPAPDPVLLERLARAATPGGRGIAVVAVGSLGPGATRVLVDENGDAHIPHMGVTVDAVQLAPESLQRVERLLADEPEVFPPAPPESVPESWPEWPDEWSSELAREAPGGWMGAWLPVNGSEADEEDPGSGAGVDDTLPPVAERGVTEHSPDHDVPPAWASAPAETESADVASASASASEESEESAAAPLPEDSDEPTAPEESEAPEEAAAPEESVAPEEAAAPEESVAPEEAAAPEESVAPEESEAPPLTGEDRAVDVDTLESDDLDDLAPNSVYDRAEDADSVAATPPLAPVPPLPEVDLPPIDTPEPAPAPEPLDLRDEPRWPDPGALAVPGESQASGAAGEQEASVPIYSPPPWELCVRIFSDHLVETVDGDRVSFRYGENPDVPNKNTHRGPELLAYLALSGRAATAEEVQDHLWWDRPIALSTVNKLVYGTRKVLGGAELLSHAQEDPLGRYRLAPTVTSDAQLLAHALEFARTVANHAPDAAAEVLRPHLAGIESVAFRNGHLGQGLMEWAAAYRVIDAVELPLIEAALLFARLACERGRAGYFDALWGVDQGLRACPYNEALVRVAMEIEALLGNTDAVNHRYLSLATKLARDELEPEPETSDLRVRLGGTSRLRSAG